VGANGGPAQIKSQLNHQLLQLQCGVICRTYSYLILCKELIPVNKAIAKIADDKISFVFIKFFDKLFLKK
jgi:hypothetical protein